MLKAVVACLALAAAPLAAQVPPYPAAFHTQDISTNGATIHVLVGGSGPAVVLLHGYGETGDMWAGHWIMEENPKATVVVVGKFLDGGQ